MAQRGKAAASRAAATRRRKRSKTALVLGGGGLTGGVYEMGALRALDLLSVNRTVNQFDVYVGTSAGSFVAAAVANGVTPEEMMRVIVQRVPTPFPDARVSSLLKPNYKEFGAQGGDVPIAARPGAADARPRFGPGLGRRRRARTRGDVAFGAVLRRRDRALCAPDSLRSRPGRRFPATRARAVSDCD